MSTPERPTSKAAWLAEKLRALIPAEEGVSISEDGSEVWKSTDYLRRRRFIECILLPGRVSAKLGGDDESQSRIDLICRVFSDAEWDELLTHWSENSFAFAHLLAGEFPAELDAVFDVHLSPRAEELTVLSGGAPVPCWTREIVMVFARLCERLEEDPAAIFLLRGKAREEVMNELWTRRRRGRTRLRERAAPEQPAPKPATVESASLENFWRVAPAVFELRYALRADELPASVLKRLDSLPVLMSNEPVDRLLEEAYAQVAIRAQAYAIGL